MPGPTGPGNVLAHPPPPAPPTLSVLCVAGGARLRQLSQRLLRGGKIAALHRTEQRLSGGAKIGGALPPAGRRTFRRLPGEEQVSGLGDHRGVAAGLLPRGGVGRRRGERPREPSANTL